MNKTPVQLIREIKTLHDRLAKANKLLDEAWEMATHYADQHDCKCHSNFKDGYPPCSCDLPDEAKEFLKRLE